MSYSNCPWQAFQAWYNMCESLPMRSTFEILPPKVGSWPYPGQGWKGLPASLASLPVPIRKGFIAMTPGANVIKPFTVVIYHYSMVLLSSCVLKHYYSSK
jgi:hypothetical protein